MRDAIKIVTAGAILTAYALIAPTVVEAVPAASPTPKALTQRLSQVDGNPPVSAVIATTGSRTVSAHRLAVSGFAISGEAR